MNYFYSTFLFSMNSMEKAEEKCKEKKKQQHKVLLEHHKGVNHLESSFFGELPLKESAEY